MYLSIDIDFWNHLGRQELEEALAAVKDSGKLCQVSDNHKHLLKSINESGCRHLINVDTHSDIVSAEDDYFFCADGYFICCGNWANHVRKDLRGTFQWVHPRRHSVRCDRRGRYNGRSPYAQPDSIGWEKVERIPVAHFPFELIAKANQIGIAVSYWYLRNCLSKKIVQASFRRVFGKAPANREKTCY